jgi:NADPH:quinone reductase-like Zn-dependent oxidoreductase
VDFTTAAALPISGLTSWQGLFDHGQLRAGQTVLIHGAAGGVGSIATQLAHESGARVIGTGRAADRDTVLSLGAQLFVDLENDHWDDIGQLDLVFDVLGGEVYMRSLPLVRPGGRIVTIAAPPPVQPENGQAIFFVVEPDRTILADIAQRVAANSLRPIIGAIYPLEEARSAFAPTTRVHGRTIITVRQHD